MKYFKAPKAMVSYKEVFSLLFRESSLPKDSETVFACDIIPLIRSSASTTVPSLLFIFPLGKSTIP